MRIKTILTAIIIFTVALSTYAQNVGTLSNDFNFEAYQAGNEETFVLYSKYDEHAAKTFSEEGSLLWTLSENTIQQYNLKRARVSGVTNEEIKLPFKAYTKGEGIVCSPSGKYFAVLETSVPARLHIFSSDTRKEVASTQLPQAYLTTSTNVMCHLNFISETEVVVCIPKKLLIYNISTNTCQKKGHKLTVIHDVTSRGGISGYVTKKKNLVNKVYNIQTKKYRDGSEQEYGNFIRVYDKANLSRYYIRKQNGKKMDSPTDIYNEYGITENRIFPLQKGSAALTFQGYKILGWVNEEEEMIIESNDRRNIKVLNYAVIESEIEKQYIRAALREQNLSKLQAHLRNHPQSQFKEMTLNGLVQMFREDNGNFFRYRDISSTFAPFPSMKAKVEPVLADYITNNEEALSFVDEYPNSKYKTKAVGNAFRSSKLSMMDVQELRSNFGTSFFLTRFDPISQASDRTKQNYVESMYEYQHPTTLSRMEEFYTNYQWLPYASKGHDVAGHLWDILVADPRMDGGYIVYIVKNVSKNETYRSWGCTQQLTDNLLQEKLQEEAKKVQIISQRVIDSSSDEWEKWLNSKYTAGIVTQAGEKKVVVYGEIRNNSRFPLPIVVNASGNLMCQFDVKGGFLGGLWNIGKALGVVKNDAKCMASKRESFQIPNLAPKKTSVYAILLNFGDVKNYGVNIADRVKVTQASYVDGVSVNVGIGSYNVSEATLRQQDEWQQFAKNGLPRVELNDFWRGEKVDEVKWEEKWREHQEQMRIIRENAELERRRKNLEYDILEDVFRHHR